MMKVNWGFIKKKRNVTMKYRLYFQIGLEDNEGGFGNAMEFVSWTQKTFFKQNLCGVLCAKAWKAMLTIHGGFIW